MINFTDDRLYAKGTCNVLLSDPVTSDVYFQTDKMSTGSITSSTNLNEIRAGLGNPIAAMIPSDAGLAVDFDSASFSLWAKSAQLGATYGYGAPVWACQTVTAAGDTLQIDTTGGAPVAELGHSEPRCLVQEVNGASLIALDGTAYAIDATSGAVSGFAATSGKTYKVWYHKQRVNAQIATIGSLIDPKVVRFEAQIAVYSNRGGGAATQGTRVGWLYYTIPFLKLQGDATVTGDQNNNDTTKISGQAIAYDPTVVSETCSDCDTSVLGYMVYVPDSAAGSIKGLAVVGGVTEVTVDTTALLPIRFVMVDGSLVAPMVPYSGFTMTLSGAPTGTSITNAGVITAGSTAGDCEVNASYTEGDTTYTCVSNLSIVSA